MIKTLEKAKEVQRRREGLGKKGYAGAVKRYCKRTNTPLSKV